MQGYYRLLDNTDNHRMVDDMDLVVNCTGRHSMDTPFVTDMANGRPDYYLLYLSEGELTVGTRAGRERMQPGQAIVFEPDAPYYYDNRHGGTLRYYWLHFSGKKAAALLDQCGIEVHTLLTVGIQDWLLRSFQQLFTEFVRREDNLDLFAAAQLTQIFVMLRRFCCRHERKEEAGPAQRLFRSLHFIHRNYCGDISIAELSRMEHLSPSQYRAVFKKIAGISPRDYIMALRIRRACELIVQTDMTIAAVGETVGYRDQLYFSRVFKAHIGVTPSQYRADPTAGMKPREL